MSLCYTRDELQELSGRIRKGAVISWLKEIGVSFVTDADGWPKVLRGSILGGVTMSNNLEPKLDFSR